MTVGSARKTARQQQSATAVRGARLNTTILKPLACRSFTTLYTFLLKGFQSSAFIANLALDFLATSVSSCRVEGLRHKQNAGRYTASAPWAYIFLLHRPAQGSAKAAAAQVSAHKVEGRNLLPGRKCVGNAICIMRLVPARSGTRHVMLLQPLAHETASV